VVNVMDFVGLDELAVLPGVLAADAPAHFAVIGELGFPGAGSGDADELVFVVVVVGAEGLAGIGGGPQVAIKVVGHGGAGGQSDANIGGRGPALGILGRGSEGVDAVDERQVGCREGVVAIEADGGGAADRDVGGRAGGGPFQGKRAG